MARKEDFNIKEGILVEYRGQDSCVHIPEGVVSIGKNAFNKASYINKSIIQQIYLPSSVISVHQDAFVNCGYLESFIVEAGNSVFTSKNGVLFTKDEKILVSFPKMLGGSYAIPDGVEKIWNKAFSGCHRIKSVTIPKSVLEIGEGCFLDTFSLETLHVDKRNPKYVYIDSTLVTKDGMSLVAVIDKTLTSFEVPDCVEIIDSYAFEGMRDLDEVIIPSTLKRIKKGAFRFCGCLSRITLKYDGEVMFEGEEGVFNLPSFLNEIEDEVFAYCAALKEIPLPIEVKKIGRASFIGCSSLKEIDLGLGVKEIGVDSFRNCDSLTTFHIPSNLTKIGEGAISGCALLENITISEDNQNYYAGNGLLYDPRTKTLLVVLKGCDSSFIVGDQVRKIGRACFEGCTDVTNVLCSKNVTTIGESAFENCTSLKSISFKGMLQILGKKAFYNCLGLTEVENLGEIREIKKETFNNCALLKHISLPKSVKAIKENAFNSCINLVGIKLHEGLEMIDDCAFENCKAITEITLPSSVNRLSDYCFSDCNSLKEVNLNEGLKSIGNGTFDCCENLIAVILPGTLNIIGKKAFEGCKNIQNIFIPSSVSVIGEDAFSSMNMLTELDVEDGNVNYSSLDSVLFNSDKTTLIKVPEGKSGEYTIPSSVEEIECNALAYCTNLSKVTIPESVKKIGFDAFSGIEEKLEGNTSIYNFDSYNADKKALEDFNSEK